MFSHLVAVYLHTMVMEVLFDEKTFNVHFSSLHYFYSYIV